MEVTMREDKKSSKGLVIGFLAGTVVGAVIALLYAPKSGKEFRQDIKRQTNELMEEASEHVEAAKSKASEIINEGKKKSEQLVVDAKKKAETLLEDAEKIIVQAKGRATEEGGKIKGAIKAGIDAYKEERKSTT
jgi:gas vesicle protein